MSADLNYRKKPVVIQAFRWTIDEVPDWWTARADITIDVVSGDAFIPTLEGEMRASVGDYIIRGVKGEIYPCKPDIFAVTYEPENTRTRPAIDAGEINKFLAHEYFPKIIVEGKGIDVEAMSQAIADKLNGGGA